MHKVLLFNPRAIAPGSPHYRIPNSILQVGAAIHGRYEYIIVDGNRETDAWAKIRQYLEAGTIQYFGATVMPGPQLKEAIRVTQRVREHFPEVVNIWGGYFPSNHSQVVLNSGQVDFIINGPGDHAFPELLDALEADEDYRAIKNLIYRESDGRIVDTPKAPLADQNALPRLPYDYLHQFYSVDGYLKPTHLGRETIAYHSSLGCPFQCSFCAVVPIYNARWKGKSAQNIYRDIQHIRENYGGDAIEFHDNNFFVSEKRSVEFARLIRPHGMNWWGEGRIDTLDKYSDESLALLRESGCRMIFFGAESGNDGLLQQMDKGGKQTGEQIKRFAARLKHFDIVPEYSFVLGLPAETPRKVREQIQAEIRFIKKVKEINPKTEIIIYIYSPVPTEGSELYARITEAGFSFPQKLEDWLEPEWEKFDLRKNPLTPWLTPRMVDKIRNFETVIHAYYPTATDIRISNFQRGVIRRLAGLRYRTNFFEYPYELKALQKFWMKYRRPEVEGF